MEPPAMEELTKATSKAASAIARYSQLPTAFRTFNNVFLLTIYRLTKSVDPTGRLSPRSTLMTEFLRHIPDILQTEKTTPTTRSKLIRLLYNLSFYNVYIRRYLGRELEIVGRVFYCLKQSIKEQLGPQNMIDILRLLQVLTYDSMFEMGMWTDPLLQFLVQQVVAAPQEEWMSSCLVVLCNLICRASSATKRLQRSSSYKKLVKRFRELLNSDERIVVVCTLVIAGYLDDHLRKCIYDPKNMSETFLCLFNVLIYGDENCAITRPITCDFLKRLVVSDKAGISAVPVFTVYAENLMHYSYFREKIQQLAELLVSLDPRSEESSKLYDLFLAFCSIPNMVSPLCSAVIDCEPTRDRLTTPILGVAQTASYAAEHSIDTMAPIKALRFLRFLCKEIVDLEKPIECKITPRQLLSLIDSSLKTTVETADPSAVSQCQRIVAGLQLTEVLSHDDIRSDVINIVTAPLCAHILEFQFVSNPIVLLMAKPPTERATSVDEWSLHGVSIVLQAMRVLAALKDYSKLHKHQYWYTLKDERLIPFVAYAISYGDHNMVHESLHLYTHCVQVPDFPTTRLGDLVASCVIAKRYQAESVPPPVKRYSPELDTSGHRSPDPLNGADIGKSINDLLDRIRSGALHIQDVRLSEVLTTYEAKQNLLKERNEQLEAALATSERMRLQVKSEFGRNNEVDLIRIRELVAENEALREREKDFDKDRKRFEDHLLNLNAEKTMLRSQVQSLEADVAKHKELSQQELRRKEDENKRLLQEMDDKYRATLHQLDLIKRSTEQQINDLKNELTKTVQERNELSDEILQERELVVRARQHAEEQKRRLEIATVALEEKNRENTTLGKRVADTETDILRMRREHEVERQRWKQENERLEMEAESMKSKGQKAQKDLDKMRRLREEMLRLAGGYDE